MTEREKERERERRRERDRRRERGGGWKGGEGGVWERKRRRERDGEREKGREFSGSSSNRNQGVVPELLDAALHFLQIDSAIPLTSPIVTSH